MKDSPPIDTTISRYLVLSNLGAGEMGEIYLTKIQRSILDVAIKFLSVDSASQQTIAARNLGIGRARSSEYLRDEVMWPRMILEMGLLEMIG